MERHQKSQKGFDLAIFDRSPREVRREILNFFSHPEDSYPRRLAADLRRIADVSSEHGGELIKAAKAAGFDIPIPPKQHMALIESGVVAA